MEKRLEFECWHCQKTYSLLRKIEEGQPILWVACPFCHKEAVVDLDPHRKKVDKIHRDDGSPQVSGDEMVYDLPKVLPTQPKP